MIFVFNYLCLLYSSFVFHPVRVEDAREKHPVHVSVTDITLDESEKELEIVIRVFIDDLETALRNDLHKPGLDLLNPVGVTTDGLVEPYIKKHVNIIIDGKTILLHYLGHEQEGEAFILYIGANDIKKVRTIVVKNDILTELHNDQSNLVNVTVKGTIKSLRLTADTPADKITFDTK